MAVGDADRRPSASPPTRLRRAPERRCSPPRRAAASSFVAARRLSPKIVAGDFGAVAAAIEGLDFAPSPSPEIADYEVFGGGKCSVEGRPASGFVLRDPAGRRATLFEWRAPPAVDSAPATFDVDGATVTLWSSGDVWRGLAVAH